MRLVSSVANELVHPLWKSTEICQCWVSHLLVYRERLYTSLYVASIDHVPFSISDYNADERFSLTKQDGLHSNRSILLASKAQRNEKTQASSRISSLKTWLTKRFRCMCMRVRAIGLATRTPSIVFFGSLASPRIVSRVTLLTLVHLARATLRHLGKSVPFFLRCQCPVYISGIAPSSPCHLIIVMKLTGYLPKRPLAFSYFSLPANVCGTRVWTVSLANNRSRRFLRSRPTGFTISSPHLIPRDIPDRTCRSVRTYICTPICVYKTAIRDCWLRRLEIETRAPLKVARSVAVVSRILEVYSRALRAADFFRVFSFFLSLPKQ